jgi:phage shock protein A
MSLLERVSKLLRANITDLLTKSEDPEKLARQLVLDMENQLLQVKTQVAVAIADQHLLKKKTEEQRALEAEWRRKAEAAVAKGQDELARGALERTLSHQRLAEGLAGQLADQTAEAETLRAAYSKLQQKLTETETRVEVLTAQLRRHRATQKANAARAGLTGGGSSNKLAKLTATVHEGDAKAAASRALLSAVSRESLDERFDTLEQSDQIEALLLELKERQGLGATD